MYTVVPLLNLIQKLNKEEINELLSNFACPLDKNIEEFVRMKAYDFEYHDLSRTYLIYNKKELCGIFSLAMSEVNINKNLTRKQKLDLFGTTYSLGKRIPAHLIGQISKNFAYGRNDLITGEQILDYAKNYVIVANDMTPAPMIRVDCAKKDVLSAFYENAGFKQMGSLNNENKDLDMYLIPIGSAKPNKK